MYGQWSNDLRPATNKMSTPTTPPSAAPSTLLFRNHCCPLRLLPLFWLPPPLLMLPLPPLLLLLLLATASAAADYWCCPWLLVLPSLLVLFFSTLANYCINGSTCLPVCLLVVSHPLLASRLDWSDVPEGLGGVLLARRANGDPRG